MFNQDEANRVLDFKFYSRECNRETSIREFYKNLLMCLVEQEEEFSGKRPFGNSDWKFDLYMALILAEVVTGSLDEFGNPYISRQGAERADNILVQLVRYL